MILLITSLTKCANTPIIRCAPFMVSLVIAFPLTTMFSGQQNPQSMPSSDGPISSQNTPVGQYRRSQDTSTLGVPRKSKTLSNHTPSFSSSTSTWPNLIESSTDSLYARVLSMSDIRAINQATHDEFLVARNTAYSLLFVEKNTLK